MKKCLSFLVFTFVFVSAFAQMDSSKLAPFQRYPTLPPIQILLSDSTTMYTKAQLPSNKQTLFMVFNPDCSHCQHETEEMIAHKDELKDVQIVMITMQPLWMMKDFISKYALADFPNVVVGKDIYYILPGFFDIRNLPYLAMYNKKGNLIGGFEGSLPIEKVIEILKNN